MIKLSFRDNTFIEIQGPVLTTFKRHVQVNSKKEAGGVLVGKRLINGDLVIVSASEPTNLDKRTIFSFKKHPQTHKEFIDKILIYSEGFIGFIGEWHSHPEPVPTPSKTDYKSWKKIIRDNGDNSLVFIIIGTVMVTIYYLVDDSWKEIQFNVISEGD